MTNTSVTRRTRAASLVGSRVVSTVAAVASTVALTTTATPAEAASKLSSQITVSSSDYRVHSGEQFILRGRMFSQAKPVSGATVRVQTYRGGEWHRLTGAVVKTRTDGRYRVRIILSSVGKRILRVVGDAPGDRIRVARATTEVRVVR